MYYLNSIQLHKDKDFIVNYSRRCYDDPYSITVTVEGDLFEEWYYNLKEKAWQDFAEMANDGTGIFMYMRKYFKWLDDQHDEGDGRDEDVNDGNWSICPYDDYRDLLQND
tara:strand:- start:935 stop:1264 length:330 start_codon:yes stop_codon:yes gene_type:complete